MDSPNAIVPGTSFKKMPNTGGPPYLIVVAASPRDHVEGRVPGGRFDDIGLPSKR